MSIDPGPDIPIFYEDDVTPGVFEFLNKTWITFKEFGLDPEGKYPTDWHFLKLMIFSIKAKDVFIFLVIGVIMTFLRFFLTAFVFKPFLIHAGLRAKDAAKFPESAWKFLAYSVLWGYSLYTLVLSGRHDFFYYPCRIWRGHHFNYDTYFDIELPTDIYWLYAMQLGFYVHSIYCTIFIDVERKDTMMLLFHHFLTFFLLELSFLIKYFRLGSLVLLLHDISDVLLEFTKMNIYMKIRHKKFQPMTDFVATISFALFTFSWALFRLYWFPLKLLHGSNWCAYIYHRDEDPKLYLFLNTMLLLLLCLHVYWFYFIVKIIVRLFTKKSGVTDEREYDLDDSLDEIEVEDPDTKAPQNGSSFVNKEILESTSDQSEGIKKRILSPS